ncbi:MAG: bifunctional 4-hydroxy-2-oxoglutarate aldolase/2-dehydro-3-deoxy-phosphogluconate aldolase [Ginsengibacter sp.]
MIVKNIFSWETFKTMPVVGILRNFSSEVIEKMVPFYEKSGLNTLEITMNSKGAPQIIESLSKKYPGLNIGAGTVCGMKDLHVAIESGASFIVTPILNEEIISFCVENKIPVFPGALTPTEIYAAWKLGASAVKIFPASQFGASYLKELRGPLGHIELLPTGGISIENIEHFFEAGALGVGMGSSLFDKDMISRNDYESLFLHFEKVCSKVRKMIIPIRI